MGIVIEQRCSKCGYIKTFQEGAGMRAINLQLIKQVFSCDELAVFLQKLEEGKVKSYQLVERIGYCENCHSIENVGVLCYTDDEGNELEIQKNCPSCQKPLSFSEKASICPRCSIPLERKEIGHWD